MSPWPSSPGPRPGAGSPVGARAPVRWCSEDRCCVLQLLTSAVASCMLFSNWTRDSRERPG